MPMKKISTPYSTDLKIKRKCAADFLMGEGPERETLDFLRQFARSYHVEPSLDANLCGMLMN